MKKLINLLTTALLFANIICHGQSAGPDQLICLGTNTTMAATGSGTWSALPSNPTNAWGGGSTVILNPSSPNTGITTFPIRGTYGFVWSTTPPDTMYVTVRNADSVNTYPSHFPVCPGTADTFRTNYNNRGLGQYTYQWYINSTAVAGATDSILYTSNLHAGDSVKCVVSCAQSCDPNQAFSGPWVVSTIPAAPVIAQTGSCAGHDTLILSGVSGVSDIVWFLNGLPIDTTLPPVKIIAGGNGYGNAANQISGTSSMYMDPAGNLYVADQSNNRIQRFPAGSNSGTNATTVAAYGIRQPLSVFADAAGNVYVSDNYSNKVQKFPAGSTATTPGQTVAGGSGFGSAANQFRFPEAIWVDAAGNIYVSDAGNNRVQKFPAGSDSTTSGVTVAGGNGQGSAANQLYAPSGLYIDAAGDLYVCDRGNLRIQKFSAGSTSGVTVAGGNGTGSAANQLNSPSGIYVDAGGTLYVADYSNSRVQKFPPGSSSSTQGVTVAGPNYSILATAVSMNTNGHVIVPGNYAIQEWTAPAIDSTYIPVAAGSYSVFVPGAAYNCPVPISAPVTIAPCVTDSVWPGDANHNGVADHIDLLSIGAAYGLNGITRPDRSIVWSAHYAADWSVQFLNGENTKHADCNGDAVINADDTVAIMQNFGLTHAKADGYNYTWRSGIPGITIRYSKDTVFAGDTLTATLSLGDSSIRASNVYGLAFTYHYDAAILDSTTVSFAFNQSWLGNSTNSISIHKDFLTPGIIKAAITGINHLSRSGYGSIAHVRGGVTTDNINGKDLSYYKNISYLSDITAIDELGNPIQINAGVDSNEVGYEPTGIHESAIAQRISLYPNPASESVMIRSASPITGIIITDMQGRRVYAQKAKSMLSESIDISALAAGVYSVQVSTAIGTGTAKLIVNR